MATVIGRRAAGSRDWSTTCSISRAWRPARPSRGATGCSIEELLRRGRGRAAAPSRDVQPLDRPRPAAREGRPGADERAFVNVLENARRHSGGHPCRCGRAPCTAAHAAATRADRVIVSGSSTAARASPGAARAGLRAVLPRRPPASDHRGSGLGLAIARGFTEANGGTLHVESLPGQGATFVFELPLAGASERADVPGTPPAGQVALFGTVDAPSSAVDGIAASPQSRTRRARASADGGGCRPAGAPARRRGCSSSTTSRRSCGR